MIGCLVFLPWTQISVIETQPPLAENKGKRRFFKENGKEHGLTKTGCAQVQGLMVGAVPSSCSGPACAEKKPVP